MPRTSSAGPAAGCSTSRARLGRPRVGLRRSTLPLEVCLARNAGGPTAACPTAAIRRQQSWLHDSIPGLPGEGFAPVWVLSSVAEIDAIEIEVVGA